MVQWKNSCPAMTSQHRLSVYQDLVHADPEQHAQSEHIVDGGHGRAVQPLVDRIGRVKSEVIPYPGDTHFMLRHQPADIPSGRFRVDNRQIHLIVLSA